MRQVTLPVSETPAKAPAAGFSLVELTIVLIIVGLLLGSLITPLSAQIEQRNTSETQQQMSEIREALIGFAVANGRLPRPATSPTDGNESPDKCTTDKACTGFIPWATLGVRKTDAWGKLFRYSVTPSLADAQFTLETLKGNKKVRKSASGGTENILVDNAPAVIYSAGRSNWGYADDGSELADNSTTNSDEDINASAIGTDSKPFIAREPSSSTTASGGEFDDLVVWLPPYVLINRLIAAGRLP